MNADDKIRDTNDDASISRLYHHPCLYFAFLISSAHRCNYINDPYVEYFVKQKSIRRPPIINRGYRTRFDKILLVLGSYIRFIGIQNIIKRFLNMHESGQIVSLGAGSDTRYWILKDENLSFRKYWEVDFPEITIKKMGIIRRYKLLHERLNDMKMDQGKQNNQRLFDM